MTAVGSAGDQDRFSLYDRIADEDPLPYSDNLHVEFLAQFRDEDVRRALLALPEQTLDKFKVPAAEQEELFAIVGSTKPQIVAND